MSDKLTPYGPGCEIDPDKIEECIPQTALFYTEDFVKVFRALQQREEIRKRVRDLLKSVVQNLYDKDADEEDTDLLEGAISILEGAK